MKNLFIIFVSFVAGMAMLLGVQSLEHNKDYIESIPKLDPIYTLEDIYYLEGTTVVTETGEEYAFFNLYDAFEFISIRTVTDNQRGYDCLYPEYPEIL